MNRLVLIYGIIGGGIIVSSWFINYAISGGAFNFEDGAFWGYVLMICALSTIYLGVRSYREEHLNGSITFLEALKVGLLICVVATVIYVIGWMVFSGTLAPDFAEKYVEYYEQMLENKGLDEAQAEVQLTKAKKTMEMYENPLYKILFTSIEILPVGIFISLLSAILLRRKPS